MGGYGRSTIYPDATYIQLGSLATTESSPGIAITKAESDATAAAGTNGHGFSVESVITRTGGAVAHNSYDTYAATSGTANYDHMSGFQARMQHNSSGTMNNMYGCNVVLTNGGGVVTNHYGFYCFAPTGAGTITNVYGFYCADLGAGATTYAFYSAGASTQSYLAGPLRLGSPIITAGGAGSGFTLNDAGQVRQQIYKCTTTFAAFAAAATTGDKTIATLVAKARVKAVYADTTTKYIGGAVTATTLRLGISAGGVELIASHDVFTAAVTKGLADADMGTSMTRAAQIQGAYTPSFTATTTLVARITTTTANTNALTQGSTTWWIITEVLQ